MNNTKGNSSIFLKSSSKNSLAVKNFGTKVFNELVISSWMQTKVSEKMSCQQFKQIVYICRYGPQNLVVHTRKVQAVDCLGQYCLNPSKDSLGTAKSPGPKVLRQILQVPKLSLLGIYIPNGCKHFKLFLQLFYCSEGNSHEPLKNFKKSL